MNKQILKLAIPNIISNLTVPLLGIVDLAILGHLESEIYIGAIALGGLIFNFVYWGFSFLRMGTTGMTAQAYGKKDSREISLLFFRSVLIALAGGLLLILVQTPIEWFSFLIIDGSSEVEKLASGYFFIRIYAAPATIGLYALIGWFLGMQNARFPLIIALVVNILNTALNYIFVFEFNMKSDGVALGTVIAQYSGLILGMVLFFSKYRYYIKCCNIFKLIFNIQDLKKFFLINKDILIRTVLLIFALSFFTNQSAKISDTMLAVNTILFQFFLVFSYFIDGFAYAAESLVGKYYGSSDKLKLKLIIKKLFFWGIMISIPFTLVYLFSGKNFLFILTNNHEVIAETAPFLFWIAIIPLVTFAAFLWDGIYTGATATKAMRNSMIISTLLIYLPSTYLFTYFLGNHGMWLSLMLFMLSRGVLLSFLAGKNVYL